MDVDAQELWKGISTGNGSGRRMLKYPHPEETEESESLAGYMTFDKLQFKSLQSKNLSVVVWASSDLTNSL
jgi:hypothetical protein